MLSLLTAHSRVISMSHICVFMLVFLEIGSSIASGKTETRSIRHDISETRNVTKRQSATVSVETIDNLAGLSGLNIYDVDCYNYQVSGTGCVSGISNAIAAAFGAFPQFCNDDSSACQYSSLGLGPVQEATDGSGIYASIVYEIIDSNDLWKFMSVVNNEDPGTDSQYTYAQEIGSDVASSLAYDYNTVTTCVQLSFDGDYLFGYFGVLIGWNGSPFGCDAGCITYAIQQCT